MIKIAQTKNFVIISNFTSLDKTPLYAFHNAIFLAHLQKLPGVDKGVILCDEAKVTDGVEGNGLEIQEAMPLLHIRYVLSHYLYNT